MRALDRKHRLKRRHLGMGRPPQPSALGPTDGCSHFCFKAHSTPSSSEATSAFPARRPEEPGCLKQMAGLVLSKDRGLDRTAVL